MAERKQYPLRIDADVWSAVQKWAADDFRSVNAPVEWILRDALRKAGRLPGQEIAEEGSSQEPVGEKPAGE